MEHHHKHVCPSCFEYLESSKEEDRFLCSQNNCSVESVICNGSFDETTYTSKDYLLVAQQICKETQECSVNDLVQESKEFKVISNKIRNILDNNDFSTDKEIYLEELYEELETIEKRLVMRDFSDCVKDKETGKRVHKINGEYVFWDDVLIYSVTLETGNNLMLNVPQEEYRKVKKENVEDLSLKEFKENKMKEFLNNVQGGQKRKSKN